MELGEFIILMTSIILVAYFINKLLDMWKYHQHNIKPYVSNTRENKNKDLYKEIEEDKIF